MENKDKSETPVVHHISASSIEYSHRGPVIDLIWVPKNIEIQNNGEVTDTPQNPEYNQFVSSSLDGSIFFWDLRFRKELKLLDLLWRPFIKVPLSSMDNTFDYGCTKVSIAFRGPSMLTTKGNLPNHLDFMCNDKSQLSKFFCGTEEGDLILSDWIAEKTEEKCN
jgi:WD40 repeat protein